jgi:ribose transport system substrate-binding protein
VHKNRRPQLMIAPLLALALAVGGCSSSNNAGTSTSATSGAGASSSSPSSSADASTSGGGASSSGGSSSGGASSGGATDSGPLPTGYTELSPGAAQPTADQTAALKAFVPESLQEYAEGYWTWMRLGPNPYANWTPPPAPWQFCYSSAYQGNSWRVQGLNVAKDIWGQLQKQNLTKGELIVTDANNSATQQATQINNMVQQGCNVILAMQPPSTGLCQAYTNAKEKGVLVISMETGTSCTDDIQMDFAEYAAGATTAKWLAGQLGGKGNVVMCNGIPGVAASDTRQSAAEKVFKGNPGITVSAINSQWTASTGKSQMLQFLATNPDPVDGVWDGGTCAVPAYQALQQAGRPTPFISGFEGGCYWLAAVKEMNKPSIGFPQSGGQVSFMGFEIALRMLAGQKMKGNMVLYPLPTIDEANFNDYYKDSYTTNSTCSAQPAGGSPVDDKYWSALFTGGNPVAEFTSPLPTIGDN